MAGVSGMGTSCGKRRFQYPRKLIKHWQKNRQYEICQTESGIYLIEGDIIPMQLLILSGLSEHENLWLSGLGRRIGETQMAERLLNEYEKHKNEMLYRSVMDIIVKANAEKFQEVKEEMCEALMELMKDEIKDKLDEAEIKGEIKGLKALVDVLKSLPLNFDSAYQAVIQTETYAKVSKEQVMEHWRQ